MSNFAPPILAALATIRHAVRTQKGQELHALYQILLSLALYAISETIPGPDENVALGHSRKPSHSESDEASTTGRVPDRWIPPRDGALRLNISLRTLRRRWRTPPYRGFCIPQGHGFKVSELALDEHMRRERERARR